ncbi:solute carrier family 22 member 1-like [Zerene cesonia]|uniref:solute carrier family 22 member 1-like n=1 Tax=Zerene cesonia TaxID=33412 RepID=UPI0018E5431C|nr:solute carrier family 22 member 1-like [Zerene cesonia]
MAIIFLAPPTKFTCPANETCCNDPIFDRSLFPRTIVMEWNLICENSWLKDLTQMLFQFGVLSGSLIFGIMSDKYGRRPTLVFSVVLEVFTGVISSFLPTYWSFTIVRMVLGMSVGGIMVVGFVLVMEYVGGVYRDIISVLFHVPFTLGHILLALFGYLIRDYVHFQLGISLANMVLLFYICILPESPRWLLAANKTTKAVKLMERVAKTYCFYGVVHYISHLTGNVYINVVAGGSVCLCACLIAIPLVKVMKRKTLVIVPNILSSLCFLFISLIPEGTGSVVMGCMGILCSFLVFVVLYLYCSEMFPTVVRNAAIGIASMMARLGAMIAPFVAALRPHGKWCAPVAFGILPLIAALLCLLLPETKDCELMMTIEEGESLGNQARRNTGITTEVT